MQETREQLHARLIQAGMDGDIEVVKSMLKNNPDLVEDRYTVGDYPRRVLEVVAYSGHLGIVKYICESFPKAHKQKDIDGNSIIQSAAANDCKDVVSYLCDKYKDLVTHRNLDGDTVLTVFIDRYKQRRFFANNVWQDSTLACLFDVLLKSAPELLDEASTASSNYLSSEDAELKVETAHSNPGIFKGRQTGFVYHEGVTVLHVATEQGDLDLVQKILEVKPHLANKVDGWGRTALHYATEKDSYEIAYLLMLNMERDMIKIIGGEVTDLYIAQVYRHTKTMNLIGNLDYYSDPEKYRAKVTSAILDAADKLNVADAGEKGKPMPRQVVSSLITNGFLGAPFEPPSEPERNMKDVEENEGTEEADMNQLQS